MASITSKPSSWEARVAKKLRQRDSLIPRSWRLSPTAVKDIVEPAEASRNNLIKQDIVRKSGILTAKELQITDHYTVPQLLEALREGQLTALEVTVAYCKRAAIAQQLVCGFCPYMFVSGPRRPARIVFTLSCSLQANMIK